MRHATLAAWAKEVGSKAITPAGQKRAILASIAETKSVFKPSIYRQWGRQTPKKQYRDEARKRRMDETAKNCLARLFMDPVALHGRAAAIKQAWPFRRSTSSWAGGGLSVRVVLGDKPNCSAENNRVWSDNGKWSGNDTDVILSVTPSALIFFPTMRTPDGGIVLDAKMVGKREYRMTWIQQGRGVKIRPVTGWLIKGYHSTKGTLQEARREAGKARAKALAAATAKRLAEEMLPRTFVSIEDSLKAGNCDSMTRQFAEQMKRQIGAVGDVAVRADVILAARRDTYTLRAVAVAQREHSHA